MSNYPKVTAQDLNKLRNLADQQKNQRAFKIKKRISKLAHDRQLSEKLPPITKKIGEVDKSTEKTR